MNLTLWKGPAEPSSLGRQVASMTESWLTDCEELTPQSWLRAAVRWDSGDNLCLPWYGELGAKRLELLLDWCRESRLHVEIKCGNGHVQLWFKRV